MKTKINFQYAILHYRHDLVTGEFLNVGIAMFSQTPPFFKVRLLTKYKRLTSTFPGADGEFYKKYISHLQRTFDQKTIDFNNGQLYLHNPPQKIEDIINQVLPYDDSSIFFGEARFGMAEDLEDTFEQFYARLVEHYIEGTEKTSRNDEDVWNIFKRPLTQRNVVTKLRQHTITTPDDIIPFNHAWRNGRWKILEPVSFDLMIPTNIRKKAREWRGTTDILNDAGDLSTLYFLLGKPSIERADLKRAYGDSKSILSRSNPSNFKIEIIEEDGAEDFGRWISPIIERDTQQSHEDE